MHLFDDTGLLVDVVWGLSKLILSESNSLYCVPRLKGSITWLYLPICQHDSRIVRGFLEYSENMLNFEKYISYNHFL